jgi:hypothetical protein
MVMQELQTTIITGKIIAFFIMLYFFYSCYCGLAGKAKKLIYINDYYKIGYIDAETATSQQCASPKTEKIIYIETPVVKSPETKNIKKECFNVLKAIGYSEDAAKQIIKDFFKNDTANTLEEFFVKLNKT